MTANDKGGTTKITIRKGKRIMATRAKSAGLPDFNDCRSMKVVWIPHCELNQNARVAGAAEVPAAVAGLISGLMARQG